MFRPEDIQGRLHENPFRPFRIVVSEGPHHDILNPTLVLVGQRDLQVGYATAARPTVYNRVVRVALVHIVALEELPAAAPTNEA